MNSNTPHWLNQIALWLQGDFDATAAQQVTQQIPQWLVQARPAELEVLVDLLLSQHPDDESCWTRVRQLMQQLSSALLSSASNQLETLQANDDFADKSTFISADLLESLYTHLRSDSLASAHALQTLAAQADGSSIRVLAAKIAEDPPADWQMVGLATSPLWRWSSNQLQHFFDELADAELKYSTVAVLLDLANHSVRAGKLKQHPWARRNADLIDLLSQLVVRLEKLQKDPTRFGTTVREVQQVLADSIALTVCLCDTLGLIGDPASVDVLTNAMELTHRRLQAEAAAALSRMGIEAGISRLVTLAADPVCRSRVVSYAEELDILGAIEERYRLPQALAESELVAYLADHQQYGMPPTLIELVDSRTLYWPSFEEPRDCYLFKFHYQLPQLQFSNIGIVGPLVKAFQCNLSELPVEDQYAAFAGWQAEHDEIYEVPATQMNSHQRDQADSLNQLFVSTGFQVTETIALTFMLGEVAVVSELQRDGQQFYAITNGEESFCLPYQQTPGSMTAEIVLCIFRGRKLLAAFN